MILSSFFWGYIVTQIPSGYLAGIWSAQKLISIGIFLCGLLTLLIPFGSAEGNWIVTCICRVGIGLAQGCLLPCTQHLLSKWAPPNERARMGETLLIFKIHFLYNSIEKYVFRLKFQIIFSFVCIRGCSVRNCDHDADFWTLGWILLRLAEYILPFWLIGYNMGQHFLFPRFR